MEAETGTIRLFLPISKRTSEEWALEKGSPRPVIPARDQPGDLVSLPQGSTEGSRHSGQGLPYYMSAPEN